jgi:D-amino-acid dehydrogenase
VKSVLIIGAGLIGLSTAYYAVRKGFNVTIVDRIGPDDGACSIGNAGMIVPSHFVPLAAPGMVTLGLKWMWNPESPFYIKPRLNWELIDWGLKFSKAATKAHVTRSAPVLRDMHLASRAAFEELANESNDFGLVKRGLLMLCKTAHALQEEAAAAEHARALGIPAELLDSSATSKLDPMVRMDITGSVFYPMDCHLSPALFTESLKRRLQNSDVTFLYNSEVTGWHVQANRIEGISTSTREIEADEYVLCGGAWSPATAKSLQLKIPMQAGKGYSLTLTEPRQLPGICSIFTEARVAVTPMGNTLRFAGTMEIAGINLDANPRRIKGIINSVPKYFPDFQASDFDGIEAWRGLRPCSPDGLPYVGRSQRYSNLSIATGHSMMGLSLGPITGKLMAEILSESETSIDISLLNPDRYA